MCWLDLSTGLGAVEEGTRNEPGVPDFGCILFWMALLCDFADYGQCVSYLTSRHLTFLKMPDTKMQNPTPLVLNQISTNLDSKLRRVNEDTPTTRTALTDDARAKLATSYPLVDLLPRAPNPQFLFTKSFTRVVISSCGKERAGRGSGSEFEEDILELFGEIQCGGRS